VFVVLGADLRVIVVSRNVVDPVLVDPVLVVRHLVEPVFVDAVLVVRHLVEPVFVTPVVDPVIVDLVVYRIDGVVPRHDVLTGRGGVPALHQRRALWQDLRRVGVRVVGVVL
jgi:hypothetical protein